MAMKYFTSKITQQRISVLFVITIPSSDIYNSMMRQDESRCTIIIIRYPIFHGHVGLQLIPVHSSDSKRMDAPQVSSLLCIIHSSIAVVSEVPFTTSC